MSDLAAQPDHLARTAMMCACGRCGHVWPVAFCPFDATLIGRYVPRACPWCGAKAKRELLMANRDRGDLDRYAAWLEVELHRARAEARLPAVSVTPVDPIDAPSPEPGDPHHG